MKQREAKMEQGMECIVERDFLKAHGVEKHKVKAISLKKKGGSALKEVIGKDESEKPGSRE